MAKRARLSVAGVHWHIIQRGNNRSACFYAEEDYLIVSGILERAIKQVWLCYSCICFYD